MPTANNDLSRADYAATAILAERQMVEGKITDLNGRATTIIQNMILILGTGILAAIRVRSAFIVSPILWSVWMLYAQQTDRDTRRYMSYSRWLETEYNSIARQSSATQHIVLRRAIDRSRSSWQDALLYLIPPLFAVIILLVLTAIGFHFLWLDLGREVATSFGVWMTLVSIATVCSAFAGSKASRHYDESFRSFEGVKKIV